MKDLLELLRDRLRRVTRGPRATRVLQGLGIDPKRYWLLIDLFDTLSERGEVMDQLGRNGVALQMASWIYAAIFGFMALALLVSRPAPGLYAAAFVGMTAFLLFFILLSEAGNSLMNPNEALILAHQPIDGATYTYAKLTHLVRIVFSLVPAMNAFPAVGSVTLPLAPWYFPFVLFAATLATGLLAALLCCAIYGWLIRFVPAKRLKAAGQLAGTLPFLLMTMMGQLEKLGRSLHLERWIPAAPVAQFGLAAAAGLTALAAVIYGLRSLSADYLLNAGAIARGASHKKAHARRFSLGERIALWVGGQPARAGYVYLSRMSRRDFQFRRQAFPLLVMVAVIYVPLIARGWHTSPFDRSFSSMHLAPHLFGFVMFSMCNAMIYGAEYKGRWIFQSAPVRAFPAFARGVYTAVYLQAILLPHLFLAPLFIWAWGLWHGGLFVAFSVAVASIYLSLEMRLVESIPFTRQALATGNATLMGTMIAGGVAMGAAVGLQYFLIFRSELLVCVVTTGLCAVAFVSTRLCAAHVADNIAFDLATASGEASAFYREIGS